MHVQREPHISQMERPEHTTLAPAVEWMVEVATGRVFPRMRRSDQQGAEPEPSPPPSMGLWR